MPYTLPIAAIIGLLAVTHVADVSILNYECDAQYAEARDAFARGDRLADHIPVPPEGFVAPADGFVFWVHWGRPPLSLPGLTLVRRGSFFDIWATESAEKPNPPPVH